MSASGSADAVRKTITVRCDVETAFRIWTEQMNSWWPKGHSRSGNPSTTVLMESQIGGRIYERTPEGVEHDWGRVIVWNPPRHYAYHWYLGSGPEQPTRVDVHFIAQEDGHTRVDVSHQGPQLIGELWSSRSSVFDAAWEAVLAAYVAACVG
ncbi:MAG TPA: SRPBCC domain-containing protein [Ardenticatenaceae bacterium]|jgi:uncharacterized protein YndB with AHSA1/START domain